MPVVSYPSSCVWYIEGRRWKSGDGKLANAGSGVVVALEHLDKDGAPFAKPQIKRYLLTCGHVVREHATGPLLDEFLCWEPTRGYSRLDQRKRGEAAVVGASLATVCPLSPCGAQQDAAPSTLPSDDWVLLEVKSDAFQAQSAVQRWAEGEGEAPLTVVGYPGGAGVEGQQGWPNGHIVVPRDSLEFRHARSAPAPGMYNYEGPEDTRAGMSGGGVFDRMHRLVAIHRSATDAAMQRSAVSATHIRNWLLNRGYRPALFPEWNPTPEAQRDQQPVLAPSAPPSRPPPIGWPTLGWLAAAAAGVLWAYLWLAPNIVELHITLRKQTESGGVGPLVHGARLSFSPKDFSSKEIEPGATDAQGKAIIKIRAPGNRFDTPPMSGYIVVVAPPPESDLSAQYAVRPHGMLERKQGQLVETYRDPEALDIRAQTHASVYLVKGEDWVVRTLTHGLQGSDTGLQTQIAQAMARARLSPESSREATDLWVTVLKGSRPVLPEAALSSRYDRTQRPQVERIIRSVGQVTGQGSPGVVSTGFMIGKGQLLVPLYALSTDGRGRVSFSGDSPSRDQPVLPFRRILWRSEKLKLALVELEGDAPEPLSVERSTPSVDLAGRKAFVVGYPQVTDGRIPAELKEVFAAASGRRAVMPGQLLTTRSRSEIAHDATTAGGVSGGPIVDEHSGLVLGIHQMGQWKGQNKENSGVPTWALFEDPAFVAALKDGGKEGSPELKDEGEAAAPAAPVIVVPYDPRFLGIDLPLPEVSAERHRGRVLDYVHFSVFLDERRRMPLFAASNIDRALQINVPRMPDRWMYDYRIPPNVQLAQDFYGKSDWDRGHLVSRLSVAWGPEPLARTASQSVFVWTNAVPQIPRFNQRTWLDIENEVYKKLHPESSKLSVFTGPVFDDMDLVQGGVKIPQSFWMVATYNNPKVPSKPFVHAFLQRQYVASKSGIEDPATAGVEASVVNVETIEKLTRLKFKLP